jgi:hypothetical protein
MNAVRRLLRIGREREEQSSALELLKRTPLDKLEEAVKALKKRRPAVEVRQAMIEVLSTAPLSHFETLKRVFLTHCADAG